MHSLLGRERKEEEARFGIDLGPSTGFLPRGATMFSCVGCFWVLLSSALVAVCSFSFISPAWIVKDQLRNSHQHQQHQHHGVNSKDSVSFGLLWHCSESLDHMYRCYTFGGLGKFAEIPSSSWQCSRMSPPICGLSPRPKWTLHPLVRPVQCCVREAVLCWPSAPCWPSSPSSCPAEDASGGSAPWLDTCRWLQLGDHYQETSKPVLPGYESKVGLDNVSGHQQVLFSPLGRTGFMQHLVCVAPVKLGHSRCSLMRLTEPDAFHTASVVPLFHGCLTRVSV
ncbi:uncharacterized protein LOC114869222 isoform X2 [Betta splendens]|uniref:Uncharacterized protein LOC114869222 isoform X2 n=1 Tax=Betta splendens TaxID=158456 RepID=A0A9W2X8P0_BETSP|nr:uncharacterized protein LOC114869222 isoform X2 [Betta splendens]